MNPVKSKCKNCGKESPADQFKLHYQLRMMVCPTCYSGRTQKEEQKKTATPPKPAGWDAEDEYLEKMARLKRQENQSKAAEPIPGTDYVKVTCLGCKYSFKFNFVKKAPLNCPYCSQEVPTLKGYGLF